MRKHRLSGVVIACLIALGTFAHRSDTPYRTPGTDRAGIQLASADLPAGRRVAAVLTTVADDTTGDTTGDAHDALFALVAGHAVANLSSPFGTQALLWDVRVAQVTAFLTAVAQKQAEVKADLEVMAAAQPHRAPAVGPVRSPAPPVAPPVAPAAAARPDPFGALRQCESGGNYGADTGNGYYGAYQFNVGTWRSLGFGGLPSQAPAAEQDQAARQLEDRRGWSQWPSCARRLGLT